MATKQNGVILLNKAFSGSWLDADGNIAHEIIDFLADDKGDSYVFDAPHGSAQDIYVKGTKPSAKEKCEAKYMVITGDYGKSANPNAARSACSLNVLYVIELKSKINPFNAPYSWRQFWQKKDKPNAAETKLSSALLEEFCSPFRPVLDNEEAVVQKCNEFIDRYCPSMEEGRRSKVRYRLQTALKNYKTARDNHKQLVKDTSDIKYNGKTLEEIYNEWGNECSLFVTFKAKKVYVAEKPIRFDCQKYNQQRCRGRLRQSKNPEDYEDLMQKIKGWKNNGRRPPKQRGDLDCLVRFFPKKVAWEEKFARLPQTKTFLNLIELEDYEQAYTNMLWTVLRTRNGLMMKEFCKFIHKRTQDESNKDKWSLIDNWSKVRVDREKSVETKQAEDVELEEGARITKSNKSGKKNRTKKGRMDICADVLDKSGIVIQRVIIENKIESGLNGKNDEKNSTQLSMYYNNWGKWGTADPLCFVIAPKYREDEIKRDIAKNDQEMTKLYSFLDYGQVADFIDKHKGMIPVNEITPSFVDEIIRSFRAHSLPLQDYYAWLFLLATERGDSDARREQRSVAMP